MRLGLAMAACLALAGCSAVDILRETDCTDKDPCPAKEVGGIPFNVKVPANVQTTKWALPTVVVKATMEVTQGSKKTKKELPYSPVAGPQTDKVMQALTTLRNAIDGQTVDEAAAAKALGTFSDAARTEMKTVLDNAKSGKTSTPFLMAANTLDVEAVLSKRQYYYRPRLPLMGSVDASIDLNKDGTMTKSSVNVTDKTAETLVGLFPFKELFSSLLSVRKSYTDGDAT